MELMCQKIQNPLNDDNTLMKVFESYSKSTNGRSFYDELLNVSRDKEINNEDSFNKFYVFMYNNWKDRLIHYGKEKIAGIFPHNNITGLIEYLKWAPNPQTKEDVDRIMIGKYSKITENPYKSRENFELSAFRWDRDSKGKWYSCISEDVFNYKNKHMDENHILFVNVDKNQIYNFAMTFVKICDQEQLPYNFKFILAGHRDDEFQIYADSKHLIKYINIIEQIKEKYPYLININNDVPLLTGKISDGLSYGTNNQIKDGLPYQDYFQLRCNLISTCINSTTVDYIRKNKNRKLDYHGMNMSLYEFLALKAKDNYIEKMREKFVLLTTKTNEKEASNELGFTHDELLNVTFSANVYSKMMMNLDKNLDIIAKSNGEFKSEEIDSPRYLMDILKELSQYLYQMDKDYRENFINKVNIVSTNNSIDRFNFSISSNASDLENMIYESISERGMYR